MHMIQRTILAFVVLATLVACGGNEATQETAPEKGSLALSISLEPTNERNAAVDTNEPDICNNINTVVVTQAAGNTRIKKKWDCSLRQGKITDITPDDYVLTVEGIQMDITGHESTIYNTDCNDEDDTIPAPPTPPMTA